MANWCAGTLKVRGTYQDILRFFKESVDERNDSWGTSKALIRDSVEWVEISIVYTDLRVNKAQNQNEKKKNDLMNKPVFLSSSFVFHMISPLLKIWEYYIRNRSVFPIRSEHRSGIVNTECIL